MAVKQGGKTVQINGEILENFRRALQAEGWTWGLTKKVESLLKEYALQTLKAHKRDWKAFDPTVVLEERVKGVGVRVRKPSQPSPAHPSRK
jgi:hypothetical protein